MTYLEQGSDAWHKFRNSRIGASDAAIIMEVSPWSTAYNLWEVKQGLVKVEENEAMRRGKDLEPIARDAFVRKTHIQMNPDVRISHKRDWMIASLDGIDPDEKHIVEIKCPGQKSHEMAKSGKVPEVYYPQLQHQLEVTGLDMAYYFSYVSDDDNVILEVGRNTKYIEEMIEKEYEFYKCLRDFIAPKLTDKDFVCKNDPVWNELVSEYFMISQMIKKQNELKDLLIEMSEGKNCIGGGAKLQKIIRKGNIDYSAIPELKGVDLEKYRKEPIECIKITKE